MPTTRMIATEAELATLREQWNTLSGRMPLRSWEWLATWWSHYGQPHDGQRRCPARRLKVLAVHEGPDQAAGPLIGIAPWYLDDTLVRGSVIRPLGSGEVCTDHLSLLCRPDRIQTVATAVAQYLTVDDDSWDRLELPAVDADDESMALLATELTQRDCVVSRQSADNCWAIQLPDSWDAYLAAQSKSHRKQLRRFERRVLESDRVTWYPVRNRRELETAWPVLVDLHQRRRRSLGEPGCFASRPFAAFHQQTAGLLLARGQLRLSWLELDGTPVAAEYHLADDTTTYAYQGGVDPDRLDEEPGRLSNMLTIRRAIEEGHTRFDFLRGDEPYKAHWRAAPQPTFDYRVVPNRRLARLRGRVLQAAGSVGQWIKQSSATPTK